MNFYRTAFVCNEFIQNRFCVQLICLEPVLCTIDLFRTGFVYEVFGEEGVSGGATYDYYYNYHVKLLYEKVFIIFFDQYLKISIYFSLGHKDFVDTRIRQKFNDLCKKYY